MAELDAFALGSEKDGVFADDIGRAKGMDADLAPGPLPAKSFTTEHGHIAEVLIAALCHLFAKMQGSSTGRVFFAFVMRLGDFDI